MNSALAYRGTARAKDHFASDSYASAKVLVRASRLAFHELNSGARTLLQKLGGPQVLSMALPEVKSTYRLFLWKIDLAATCSHSLYCTVIISNLANIPEFIFNAKSGKICHSKITACFIDWYWLHDRSWWPRYALLQQIHCYDEYITMIDTLLW